MKHGMHLVVNSTLCLIILLWAALPKAYGNPESITIGGVFSLSGADSSVGNQVKNGYLTAIQEINSKGGVYVETLAKKLPLELKYLDMEASPEKAIARTETLYSKYDIAAYVGTTFFSAAVSVIERQKVPAVVVASSSQGIHERGYKYWFTPMGTSVDIAREIFELLDGISAGSKPSRLIIFEEQTDWGIEMSDCWQREINKREYDLVGIRKYNMLARDFSPQVMAAKAADAEILLSNPIMPDGMSIIRKMKQLNYNPKAVIMIRAPDDLPWTRAMGPLGDYVIFSSGWHHGIDLPGVSALNAKHLAQFDRPADVMTGPAFASIQIIADAIQRAGCLDPVDIRNAISATDMTTVVGPIKFRPDGTVTDPIGCVGQWQRGNQELIWPERYRTKKPVYPTPGWSER
jgi:branched-chain amino acid transport system substrate-binding protein